MSAVLSFVFKRRIGRLSFAVATVVLLAVVVFTLEPIDLAAEPAPRTIRWAVEVAFVLAVVYRLHDLGWSGWWALALVLVSRVWGFPHGFPHDVWTFLPTFLRIVEFSLIVVFSLLRGQPHDNEWGPVPWPGKRATPDTPEA